MILIRYAYESLGDDYEKMDNWPETVKLLNQKAKGKMVTRIKNESGITKGVIVWSRQKEMAIRMSQKFRKKKLSWLADESTIAKWGWEVW